MSPAKTIGELREELQGPRRPFDTFYGKHVMRRGSIYLTVLFSRTAASPTLVTFLSVLAGLCGVGRLWTGDWIGGVLWVNGWYLLDHVDGELARLTKKTSATGLFFDTLANAIVQPLAFYALGAGLARSGGGAWQQIGALAAYGSLMMLVVPYCTAETLMNWKGPNGRAEKTAPAMPMNVSFPKRAFVFIHQLVTFPVILPLLTLATLGFYWLDARWLENVLRGTLAFYAAAVTVVWTARVVHIVLTRKIDTLAGERA